MVKDLWIRGDVEARQVCLSGVAVGGGESYIKRFGQTITFLLFPMHAP